jgi:hypothetical protein
MLPIDEAMLTTGKLKSIKAALEVAGAPIATS